MLNKSIKESDFDGVNPRRWESSCFHTLFLPRFPNWRILPNVRLDLFGDTGDVNYQEAMTEMRVPNEAKLCSLVLH